MGKNSKMKLRCNGKVLMQCVAIAWSCLLLALVFAGEVHAANKYTITATAGSGGSISPSGAVLVNNGANKTFTITPNTGYHIADVVIDGTNHLGAQSSYTFINVTANHTIAATFTINTYTITATAGSGGSISPSGAVVVSYGGSQAFTITPNAGYHVADVTVDSVSQGAIPSYPFTNVTANHTIAATFAINTYTITATAGSGGSISPSGTLVVNSGSNQTFTITPNTGYHVADVTVDSVSQGAITSYAFTNVTANHTIAATFAINTPSLSSEYFYDDLGRLARVVQGTTGVIYNYDELGNLISTTSATTSGGSPVLTAINPNVLFVGSRMLVTITGQNLLTTETVTANGGHIYITDVVVTDTRITAEMTPDGRHRNDQGYHAERRHRDDQRHAILVNAFFQSQPTGPDARDERGSHCDNLSADQQSSDNKH